MKSSKNQPEAMHLNLFATDVVPMVESMGETQLADTVAGLRAIIRYIHAEPKRRQEVQDRAAMIQRHNDLKKFADSLEVIE